jgi:hypothetical protein
VLSESNLKEEKNIQNNLPIAIFKTTRIPLVEALVIRGMVSL